MAFEKKVPDPLFVIRTGVNGIACLSEGLTSWQDLDSDDFVFSGYVVCNVLCCVVLSFSADSAYSLFI